MLIVRVPSPDRALAAPRSVRTTWGLHRAIRGRSVTSDQTRAGSAAMSMDSSRTASAWVMAGTLPAGNDGGHVTRATRQAQARAAHQASSASRAAS